MRWHRVTGAAALEGSAVLGAATGLRGTVALAALIIRRSDGLPAVLRHPAARRIAAIADGAELVIDKLPMTPFATSMSASWTSASPTGRLGAPRRARGESSFMICSLI